MNKLVELHIKDFRAIKEADIQINGITVVAGINGSGKSTLSKLLYYAFRNANSFEELVLSYTNMQLQPYFNVLDQILNIYYYYNHKSVRLTIQQRFLRKGFRLSSLDETSLFLEEISELCNRFLELEASRKVNDLPLMSERLYMILRSTLKSTDSTKELKHLLEDLIQQIKVHVNKAEETISKRPSKILKESLVSAFDAKISKNLTLKEYGDYILGDNITNVPLLHYIKKVVYIDTPMVIGMETYPGQPSYWKELNELLKLPPKRGYKRTINNFIKEDILKGDASFDNDMFSGGFKY